MRVSALTLLMSFAAAFPAADFAAPVADVAASDDPISGAFLQSQLRTHKGPGPIKSFFSLLLGAYTNGVSPADGPTCAFQPTCSGYAGLAIHRHGLAEGILLTGDRLMRCNGYDKSAYPMVGPERRFFDPVP